MVFHYIECMPRHYIIFFTPGPYTKHKINRTDWAGSLIPLFTQFGNFSSLVPIHIHIIYKNILKSLLRHEKIQKYYMHIILNM